MNRPARLRRRLVAVGLAALAAAGCVPKEQGPSAGAARPALREVTEPDLANLDPAVRSQLQAMRQGVLALAAQPAVDARSLGQGYGELGRLYHAYELYTPARDAYANAEALAPDDYRWPHLLGNVERSLGDAEAAAAAFERAVAHKSDDVAALESLARVDRELRRPEQAERAVQQALAIRPDSAGALLVGAQLAADRGDAKAAAALYEKLLTAQPSATKLHQPLVQLYRALDRPDAAERQARLVGDGSLVIDDPLLLELTELRSGAQSDLNAGNAAFEGGDFSAAAAAFQRAAEAQPDNANAWVNLGSARFRAGDTKGAMTAYRRALKLKPNDALTHFNLGTVLARDGRDDEAVAEYRAALAVDPRYAPARFNLANALRRGKRCEEAIGLYRQLVDDDPGDGPARLGEAVCLVDLGRHADARQRLKEALQAMPRSLTLADAGARLLAACPDAAVRDGKQALKLAKQLVAIQSTPRYLETLAMALAENGAFTDAVTAQQAALAGAESAGAVDDLPRLRAELAAYRGGHPCRDPAIQ
jgi:tetratricopeptide (TPR) repeat protein